MRNVKKIIWGIVLLAVGVLLGLKVFGVEIDIFFPGWWTLFMIVPGLIGLITEKHKTGNIILLLAGVTLLLASLEVISFEVAWKIGIPVIIIVIAVKMIISGFRRKEKKHDMVNVKINGEDIPEGTAIFGAKDINFNGQVFEGGEFNAIFGGIECDLRGAIVEHDCMIKANGVFGGVDILLPKGVNVKVDSNAVFGGVDELYTNDPDAPVTIYIKAAAIFGGVDIK